MLQNWENNDSRTDAISIRNNYIYLYILNQLFVTKIKEGDMDNYLHGDKIFPQGTARDSRGQHIISNHIYSNET